MNKFYKSWPKIIFVAARGFHLFFSFGGCCRFTPSCSNYCAEAIQQRGILVGGWMSVKRVLKCHPWGNYGFDSVGERLG
jgi:uncharacterized protein